MQVPLGAADFLGVFTSYNQAVWPAQLVLLALALAAVLIAVRPMERSGNLVLGSLALLWLWSGAVFWVTFFARLGPAGYVFGGAFVVQAVVFAVAAVRAPAAAGPAGSDARRLVGAILLSYALVFYPAIGAATGHAYPSAPTFRAPCPLTIFTFGLLLLWGQRIPVHLYLIPLAWSLLGITAAVRWGVVEDFGLPVAGLAGAAVFLLESRGFEVPAPESGVGETPSAAEGIRRLH